MQSMKTMPSRLLPQWLCGSSCTWAYDIRFIYIYIYIYIYTYIYDLSINLSIYLSIYLSTYLSI